MQIIGELNGKKGEALMLAGGLALRPSALAVFAEGYEMDQFSLGTLVLDYDLYSTDAFTQFQSAYHLIEQWIYWSEEGQIEWETDDAPEAPEEDIPEDAIL
jgi:hypothetical protein